MSRDDNSIPRHVAIIMDGNGRWATHKGLPRGAGHKAGVSTLRNIVQHSARKNIEVLTVFAFSRENWYRPRQEVEMLMELFLTALRNEVDELHENNIKLSFIGNRDEFSHGLKKMISDSENKTSGNSGMKLLIAANYSGRWDIINACSKLAKAIDSGELTTGDIDEAKFSESLSLSGLPDPDLLIRTGGEQRISNYLLWHCAYTELYFTDVLWPDFTTEEYEQALLWFEGRQRRFGRTGIQ